MTTKTTATSQDAKTNRPRLSGAALKAQQKAKRDKRISRTRLVIQTVMIIGLALIGVVGSFQHLRELGILAGQDATHWWSPANLTPISLDMMIVIGSIQLRRLGITDVARLIARVCSIGGLALSLAGNVLVAWLELPAGAGSLQVAYTLIWSAVPVASLLGATEMLTHTHKDRPTVTRVASRKPKAAKASQKAAQSNSRSESPLATMIKATSSN